MDWNAMGQQMLTDAGSAAAGNITNTLLGGIFGDGGHSAREQMRYQRDINQQMALWNKENITDKNFAMENAEWDRRFAAQNAQWKLQQEYINNYNSPLNQVKRLREAGINPAGIGSVQSPIAQGADVGAPYSPQAAGYPAQTPISQNWEQASLMRAQTANINADTRRKEAETAGQNIENYYLDNWWSGQLQSLAADVQLKKGKYDLSKAQESECKANQLYVEQKTKNAAQELENLKESMALTSQQILNLKSSKEYQDQVNKYFERNQEAMIKELYSRTRANYASETEAYAKAKEAVALTRNYYLQGDYQDLQNNLAVLTFNDKYLSIRAQYNADTNRFNLQSHEATWLDRNEIYKTSKKFDLMQSYANYFDKMKTSINQGVGLGPIKINWNETEKPRNENFFNYINNGDWGSSGR